MGLEEKDPKNVPFKWVRFIIRNKSWCLLGRERRTVTKKENKENKKTLSAVRETATRSLLWIKGTGRMMGKNGESRNMKGGSEHKQTEERGVSNSKKKNI